MSVQSQEHEVWPRETELVGNHQVGVFYSANLETDCVDVTAIAFSGSGVSRRLGCSQGGLFCESRSEDKLELE